MKSKKIWLGREKKKYVVVKVADTREEMQAFYEKWTGSEQESVEGVHLAFTRFEKHKDGRCMSPQTGIVLLHRGRLGAGVVTHELMHAVLWAKQHKWKREDYPRVIRSMDEEERLLHQHTYAVQQFYDWYWKKLAPAQE